MIEIYSDSMYDCIKGVGVLKTGKSSTGAVDIVKEFMSAKSDIIFKLLFGDELNKDLLITFLMAVLELPLSEFAHIEITDPHSKRKYKKDKLAILDIKVKTATGKIINIEIQVQVALATRTRIVFYNARLMAEQLVKGDDYDNVKKVISIIIAGDTLLPEHTHYHDKFVLYSPETKTQLTDIIEFHTLELSKLPKESDGTDLCNWLEFINADSEEDLKMLAKKSPKMKAPVKKLLKLNQDEHARALYEAREKQRRDHTTMVNHARREGIKEGILEGEQKKAINTAKYLLGINTPVEHIIGATGLTKKEIESL